MSSRAKSTALSNIILRTTDKSSGLPLALPAMFSKEPNRHFRFTDEGITNEIVAGRRTSSSFISIAKPKKKVPKQLQLDTEWTQDRMEENKLVNAIRARVQFKRQGQPGQLPFGRRGDRGQAGWKIQFMVVCS